MFVHEYLIYNSTDKIVRALVIHIKYFNSCIHKMSDICFNSYAYVIHVGAAHSMVSPPIIDWYTIFNSHL